MTPRNNVHASVRQTSDHGERPRVSFRQPVNDEGFIDAGWWPRSRNLTVELPPFLDVLWTSSREVMRVSYALDFWDPAPRKLRVEGRVVRLGGFHTQMPMLLSLVDAWGRERIDVLVIPPETDRAVAERALTLASGDPSSDRPEQILDRARDEVAHELLTSARISDNEPATAGADSVP